MPDLADLFPSYKPEWIGTSGGRIFARVGGKGPPLLLLHGFPQTHVMWNKVAPQLAEHFTVIVVDLPGYGWSDMPESDADHTPYTKRAMAQTLSKRWSNSATCISRWRATTAAAACPIGSRSTIPDGCRSLPCSISCRPTITGRASTGCRR